LRSAWQRVEVAAAGEHRRTVSVDAVTAAKLRAQ